MRYTLWERGSWIEAKPNRFISCSFQFDFFYLLVGVVICTHNQNETDWVHVRCLMCQYRNFCCKWCSWGGLTTTDSPLRFEPLRLAKKIFLSVPLFISIMHLRNIYFGCYSASLKKIYFVLFSLIFFWIDSVYHWKRFKNLFSTFFDFF